VTPDLTKLTPAQALGITGAGEARSELVPGIGWEPSPLDDMVAVMWTVRHRLEDAQGRFGGTIPDVCFEPAQYSCWNAKSGPNHDWCLEQARRVLAGLTPDVVVRDCISSAARILGDLTPDTVNGATHYFAPKSMVPPGRIPVWARGKTPCAIVGQHLFFKGV
jgi:hypothetical protein